MALFAAKAITSSGEPFTSKHYLKILIACISYANLCFLNAWAELYDHGSDFLRIYSTSWRMILAVALDILLVAALVFLVVCLALRSGRPLWIRLLKWFMILALLIPVNVIRTDESFASMQRVYIEHATALRIGLIVGGAALGIFLILRWERLSSRVTTVILILMAPTMPLAMGNAIMQVVNGPPNSRFPDKPLQPALPQPPGTPRVVWVIFDEWDQYLTYEGRPAGVALPEVDRFQKTALRATRVIPPAHRTIVSIPSLLTGVTYIDTMPQIPSEILLKKDPNRPLVPFTQQETIFSAVRRGGMNVGIAGWYLPYCRLIPECTDCSWHSAIGLSARLQFEDPHSLPRLMVQVMLGQVKKIPLLYRLGINLDTPAHKRLHALSYELIHADMMNLISDPRLNLAYVHLSVPHLPAIYDAKRDEVTAASQITYLDNLRLVDRTIRDLRDRLEKAGLWDSTTVLLTADHPLRVSDKSVWPDGMRDIPNLTQHSEVPYLLKMAGQTTPVTYNHGMQEVVTKDLLLAILSRQVTTAEQAVAWLDAHPARP